jgi:hypothetical protein
MIRGLFGEDSVKRIGSTSLQNSRTEESDLSERWRISFLCLVLFHHFDRFLIESESCFEKEYGLFRPIVNEVVELYLDCGNPRSGFARIHCPDCHGGPSPGNRLRRLFTAE